MNGIHCCASWEAAQQFGTDNEEASELLGRTGDGDWHMGSYELHPIAYCPWCGSKVAPVHPLVAAAKAAVDALDAHGSWDGLKTAIGNLATELEKLK